MKTILTGLPMYAYWPGCVWSVQVCDASGWGACMCGERAWQAAGVCRECVKSVYGEYVESVCVCTYVYLSESIAKSMHDCAWVQVCVFMHVDLCAYVVWLKSDIYHLYSNARLWINHPCNGISKQENCTRI